MICVLYLVRDVLMSLYVLLGLGGLQRSGDSISEEGVLVMEVVTCGVGQSGMILTDFESRNMRKYETYEFTSLFWR